MNPNDSHQQQILREAAADLRSATNAAASNALKKKQMKRLEVGQETTITLSSIDPHKLRPTSFVTFGI